MRKAILLRSGRRAVTEKRGTVAVQRPRNALVGAVSGALCLLVVVTVASPPAHSLTKELDPARHDHLRLSPPLDDSSLAGWGLASSPSPTPANAGVGMDWSGGRAVAHRNGARKVGGKLRSPRPKAELYPVGIDAWEPTIGITKEGDLFYAAFPANNTGPCNPCGGLPDLMRSRDNGKTWEVVSPRAGPVKPHVGSLDPYVYVDEDTSRVFTIDLYVACSILSFSDDAGETWVTNPIACGRPVNDHQTLFSGPPAISETVVYPNVLYYCWNDILTSSCSKSLDGGISFASTGAPAFFPEQGEGGLQHCGGLHGRGVAANDGTIYLPREYCGEPWLATSNDEGLTWTRVRVADNGVAQDRSFGSAADPSVAVDAKRNIYYGWIADDQLPYLSVSRDGGKSWSKPIMLAAPGVKATSMFSVAAGSPGRVAFSYMGTDKPPASSVGPASSGPRWHAYIGMTVDGLKRDPLLLTARANAKRYPFKTGPCGVRRCEDVGDFLDVQIGPDGTPWAAFVNACIGTEACGVKAQPPGVQGSGVVGRLVGGPRLR